MHFDLHYTDTKTKARAGSLHTDHGVIETPIFMPVGTAGSVKGVHQHELKNDIEAQIILGNTYHLYLKPGIEVLQAAAGRPTSAFGTARPVFRAVVQRGARTALEARDGARD